jgi:hypothetical protein
MEATSSSGISEKVNWSSSSDYVWYNSSVRTVQLVSDLTKPCYDIKLVIWTIWKRRQTLIGAILCKFRLKICEWLREGTKVLLYLEWGVKNCAVFKTVKVFRKAEK